MMPYIRLRWHVSKIDNSIPVALIRFGLVEKIRSVHEEYFLVIKVGLLFNWL